MSLRKFAEAKIRLVTAATTDRKIAAEVEKCMWEESEDGQAGPERNAKFKREVRKKYI